MTRSPVKDEIQQRHLGLPPHLLSASLLGWDGIGEAAAGLGLSPGDTLVDLACGRGGYGLEIAARTGARLVGVDFSAEAVRQAREQARRQARWRTSASGTWPRPGWMPVRPTPSCASTRSTCAVRNRRRRPSENAHSGRPPCLAGGFLHPCSEFTVQPL